MGLWVSALKMVPWGDVIQATPDVIKAAKGLLKKSPPPPPVGPELPDIALDTPPKDGGELALQHVVILRNKVQELEAAQRASALLLEQMAQQQAQIIETVSLLRVGATRLAWACTILGACTAGLLVYIVRI